MIRPLFESLEQNRRTEIRMTFQGKGSVTAEPTLLPDDGFVLTTCDGRLYRVEADGTERWSRWLDGMCYAEPAVSADGEVVVGNNQGTVRSFSPEGEPGWIFTGSSAVRVPVSPDREGRTFVRGDDGYLRCLDPDGDAIWKEKVASTVSVPGHPVLAGDCVVVGGADGVLHAYKRDGTPAWTYACGSRPVPSPAVDSQGNLFVAGEGRLISLDSHGRLRWLVDLPGARAFEVGPQLGPGKLVLHDGQNLYQLTTDGGLISHRDMGGRIQKVPGIDEQGRVFLNLDRALVRVDEQGEIRWSHPSPPEDEFWCGPVCRSDGSVLIGGKQGRIYAIQPLEQLISAELPTGAVAEHRGSVVVGGVVIRKRD